MRYGWLLRAGSIVLAARFALQRYARAGGQKRGPLESRPDFTRRMVRPYIKHLPNDPETEYEHEAGRR